MTTKGKIVLALYSISTVVLFGLDIAGSNFYINNWAEQTQNAIHNADGILAFINAVFVVIVLAFVNLKCLQFGDTLQVAGYNSINSPPATSSDDQQNNDNATTHGKIKIVSTKPFQTVRMVLMCCLVGNMTWSFTAIAAMWTLRDGDGFIIMIRVVTIIADTVGFFTVYKNKHNSFVARYVFAIYFSYQFLYMWLFPVLYPQEYLSIRELVIASAGHLDFFCSLLRSVGVLFPFNMAVLLFFPADEDLEIGCRKIPMYARIYMAFMFALLYATASVLKGAYYYTTIIYEGIAFFVSIGAVFYMQNYCGKRTSHSHTAHEHAHAVIVVLLAVFVAGGNIMFIFLRDVMESTPYFQNLFFAKSVIQASNALAQVVFMRYQDCPYKNRPNGFGTFVSNVSYTLAIINLTIFVLDLPVEAQVEALLHDSNDHLLASSGDLSLTAIQEGLLKAIQVIMPLVLKFRITAAIEFLFVQFTPREYTVVA